MSIQGINNVTAQTGAMQFDAAAVNKDNPRVNAASPLAARADQTAQATQATQASNKLDNAETEKTSKYNRDDLMKATEKINKVVSLYASELKFTIDESSGADVVKVIDLGTKEVIRQIPSEEMIRIAESIDRLQGLLVRQQA